VGWWPMLEVRSLMVTYGATEAVRGIDLDVADGGATALLGANGAGKTSTLRAICGVIPSKGQTLFDGKDVSGIRPENLARLGLIHVPEGRHVFGSLTVQENLLVGMTARAKRPPAFSLQDVYDLFPTLTRMRTRRGWALSGGEQQMVAIGRALLSSPRLLMLDEPSLGLAPLVVQAVYNALGAVKHRVSILLVEQNASLGLQLCDQAYVLQAGRLVLSGASADLSDRQAMLDSYLGHDAATSDDTTEAHGTVAAHNSSIDEGLSPA
jgi:branched-chain amino acid transport system ATP-binding protein